MANGYCAKIGSDLVNKSCEAGKRSVVGLKQKILLFNKEDLPISGITKDVTNPDELITGISMNSGTSAFFVEGYLDQIRKNITGDFSESDRGVIHRLDQLMLQDNSVAGRAVLNSLIGGANVMAMVEARFGDSDKYAFRLLGLEYGMRMVDLVWASNENRGLASFSLVTPDGFRESLLPHGFEDTNYDTSATAFGNKFAAA